MHARGVDLPPLVEGGDPWCEHDVEFLEQAKTTLPAGWVVASNSLFEQVPGDVEVRASLLACGCADLVLCRSHPCSPPSYRGRDHSASF